MTGVFAESTYLMVCRDLGMGVDHLVMKPRSASPRESRSVGSSRIVYTTERDWEFIDFLVDSRGCVLLFEKTTYKKAVRLRVLSFNSTTSTKTRDLEVHTEYPVCVQTTEF